MNTIPVDFDRITLRKLLDLKQFRSLPIRKVNEEELYHLKESWFYNPTHYYPKGVRRLKNEVGHDEKYRYVLES